MLWRRPTAPTTVLRATSPWSVLKSRSLGRISTDSSLCADIAHAMQLLRDVCRTRRHAGRRAQAQACLLEARLHRSYPPRIHPTCILLELRRRYSARVKKTWAYTSAALNVVPVSYGASLGDAPRHKPNRGWCRACCHGYACGRRHKHRALLPPRIYSDIHRHFPRPRTVRAPRTGNRRPSARCRLRKLRDAAWPDLSNTSTCRSNGCSPA
ncbi:hypothetical protein FA95DRAFT_1284502 [Auriscalpium vulgare]|uniref:Uncharacterized protein n=1 Tax=Auriscalpium vulgare TaxID=40419 RepID=A0ACB8R2N1_9AGAM|nr:hypothetical protein FA95DRAFT_1284502 [Auriscalpium vulgare]